MEHVTETPKISPQDPMSNGTWVQITFILDPELYQILWERAEEEHRTLSCLAREAVIHFLKRTNIPHLARKTSVAKNSEDLL
ncbi:MAG: hypothetical protein V1882_07475 [Candidatus Omnitrophota bacterium]